jgi:competence protein ComFB
MNSFQNVMETLVIAKLDEIWGAVECCKCDKCRNDILAHTLNELPPKYVVTDEGALYARLCELSYQLEFDILIALAKSIKIVMENPKHNL